MKIKASITVEFLLGESFPSTVHQASHLCKELGLAYVKYDFNGVSVSVRSDIGTITDEELLTRLHEVFHKEHKHLIF